MKIIQTLKAIHPLICFGLRQIASDAVAEAAGRVAGNVAAKAVGVVVGEGAAKAVEFLVEHFTDSSEALPKAVDAANQRAWKALGLALAGETLWQDAKNVALLNATDRKAIEQVKTFVEATALFRRPEAFRKDCLADLKRLRASKDFQMSRSHDTDFKKDILAWQRYVNQQGVIDGAWQAVNGVADKLAKDYPHLAELLRNRIAGNQPPLLAGLFTFYLNKEIGGKAELEREVSFNLLRNLYDAQATAFAEVGSVLDAIGDKIDAVLDQLGRIEGKLDFLAELQAHLNGVVKDFREEHRANNQANQEQLDRIEAAVVAGQRGEHGRAESIFVQLSREQPASPVLAVAVAASQAAGHNFIGAAESLVRATRLRPGDAQLAEISRQATQFSRDVTPLDPRPEAIKRPKPGDTLNGWRLEHLLGFGGWGQVFRARQGDQVRALKIMHAELSGDAEFVRRFKREMGMLISLGTHPHLVWIDPDHLFDKADDWGCWYFVMEYVHGITLERYLQKHGALTLTQVRSVFTGLAEGLAYAHARGIIHRDIKPANILLRKKADVGQGRAVMVDFGLAGLVNPHSRGMGYTALFAAPEQMRDGTSDSRSDIYSFAATIYHCLLHGDTAKHSRFKAKLLPADIPAEVRALLERCLDNDPEERPRDASAFVSDWSKTIDDGSKPRLEDAKLRQEQKAAEHQLREEQERNQRELAEGEAAELKRRLEAAKLLKEKEAAEHRDLGQILRKRAAEKLLQEQEAAEHRLRDEQKRQAAVVTRPLVGGQDRVVVKIKSPEGKVLFRWPHLHPSAPGARTRKFYNTDSRCKIDSSQIREVASAILLSGNTIHCEGCTVADLYGKPEA